MHGIWGQDIWNLADTKYEDRPGNMVPHTHSSTYYQEY